MTFFETLIFGDITFSKQMSKFQWYKSLFVTIPSYATFLAREIGTSLKKGPHLLAVLAVKHLIIDSRLLRLSTKLQIRSKFGHEPPVTVYSIHLIILHVNRDLCLGAAEDVSEHPEGAGPRAGGRASGPRTSRSIRVRTRQDTKTVQGTNTNGF